MKLIEFLTRKENLSQLIKFATRMPHNINSKDQAYRYVLSIDIIIFRYPFISADVLVSNNKLADALVPIKEVPLVDDTSSEEEEDADEEETTVTSSTQQPAAAVSVESTEEAKVEDIEVTIAPETVASEETKEAEEPSEVKEETPAAEVVPAVVESDAVAAGGDDVDVESKEI